MKKIVFGGFCMIVGVMLFDLAVTEGVYYNVDCTPVLTFFAFSIFILGFVLGIKGLSKD